MLSDLELVGRLGGAALLGSAIGFEHGPAARRGSSS